MKQIHRRGAEARSGCEPQLKWGLTPASFARIRARLFSAPPRLCGSILCFLAVAACAGKPLATATVTAPITGTVNIGAGKPELVPVTKVILVPCEPPSQFLSIYPPLPPIAGERMSENQILQQWASDMAAYKDLMDDHTALAKWIKDRCQPK